MPEKAGGRTHSSRDGSRDGGRNRSKDSSRDSSRVWIAACNMAPNALLSFGLTLTLTFTLTLAGTAGAASSSFNPLEHLAGITPYFESPLLDPKPPQGCNVSRASYLVRHAAIYANDFDYEEYIEPFADKLGNVTIDWRRAGPLAFLATWQSPISDNELEDLTSVGRLESYKLGVDVRMRYPKFKAPKKVWTSTAERTELSAASFIQGLTAMANGTERVAVREDAARGADSLTPYKGCPKYSSSFGSNQSSVRDSLIMLFFLLY